MTFQLDTTGTVGPYRSTDLVSTYALSWSDLDAFTQGYVEALLRFASTLSETGRHWGVAFSDLAPETLARIIADCERYASKFNPSPNLSAGADFWRHRQSKASHFVDGETCRGLKSMGFPPLTVMLSADGKVRFA